MKWVSSLLLLLLAFSENVFSQKIDNEFFVLHNAIRGDSTYPTFDEQVALIKHMGYDGVEINQLESFEGMKAALDKHHFKGSFFYIKLPLEEPYLTEPLRKAIAGLKGSGTIISPYIVSPSKKYTAGSGEADTLVVRLLRQLGHWARESELQVAIYPHYGFYAETTGHALQLAKAVAMDNVGMSFNLCHWLATTPLSQRDDWQPELIKVRPFLKMVTISGANQVDSRAKVPWDDYILPLGTGSFDTFGLVDYLVKALKYTGPIGVQCYHIKADKPALLRTTMRAWQDYQRKGARE